MPIDPITIRVFGIPKGQPRPRAFSFRRGDKTLTRVYDPATAEGWKSAIAEAARTLVPTTPIEGPISMEVTFIFPRPKAHLRKDGSTKFGSPTWHTHKPDRDNCEKAVLDALTILGFWHDDAQVCAGEVRKIYGTPPGANINIKSL